MDRGVAVGSDVGVAVSVATRVGFGDGNDVGVGRGVAVGSEVEVAVCVATGVGIGGGVGVGGACA